MAAAAPARRGAGAAGAARAAQLHGSGAARRLALAEAARPPALARAAPGKPARRRRRVRAAAQQTAGSTAHGESIEWRSRPVRPVTHPVSKTPVFISRDAAATRSRSFTAPAARMASALARLASRSRGRSCPGLARVFATDAAPRGGEQPSHATVGKFVRARAVQLAPKVALSAGLRTPAHLARAGPVRGVGHRRHAAAHASPASGAQPDGPLVGGMPDSQRGRHCGASGAPHGRA